MSAPIDCLPPELLSHIFIILYQSCLYARSIDDQSYGRINYPVLFSSVSVRWRQVATKTPSLWTYIHLDQKEWNLENLGRVNFYLQRSSKLPLSVRFGRYFHECHLDIVNEHLAHLLQSFAMHLEALALAYQHTSFVKEVLSTLVSQGAAGHLRTLSLYGASRGNSIVILPQVELDQLLEPLHSLYLEAVSFNRGTIACRNLVDLQLTSVSTTIRQLTELLNANPAIRGLKFAMLELPTSEGYNLPRITLSELQNLELDLRQYFIYSLLQSLTPVHQKLSLDLCSSYFPPYKDQMINTLGRFLQQNRIVSLRVSGGDWFPFSNVLAYLPELETLGLQDRCLDSYGLHEANQNGLLPNLRTIKFIRTQTREMELGLSRILCLPSVQKIVLWQWNFVVDGRRMNLDQVRKWMYGFGATADIIESSHSNTFSHVSPFMG